MGDAAIAEISRAQVWQWAKHKLSTADKILFNSEAVCKETLRYLRKHKQLIFAFVW